MELRCPSRLHGVVIADDHYEVKCHSKHCGAGDGTTVLHYFSLTTGELIDTRLFKEPKALFDRERRKTDATHDDPAALRPA